MNNSPYANVSDMLKDAQKILSNKKLWTDAKDDATRENIRVQTEPIYERLRRNGYGDVAKNLTDSNYEQALSVVDALSKNNEPLRAVTYTPDDDVKNIYNNKERWGNATDETEKQTIANQTQAYYNSLRDNGYNDVAHALSTSNYEQSKPIYDKWMKMGKTPTRDYLHTLGQKYGMSTEDVDKLIQWDNDSKELTFGGVKVGSPDAIVDGVSYWTENNLSKLDKAFKDYISASGTTLSDSKLVDINNNGVNQKIDELWGTINSDRDKYYSEYDKVSDYANRDVTKTDEYQSTFKNIMGKYDLSAMQGRDNAVASGGASNGGNIDSYAAANAMRQQAAITAQGQALAHQLGLEAYQSRMDNTRQLLSDLGIYQKDSWGAMGDVIGTQQTEAQRLFENNENREQRLFDNDQTAKNNEVARLVKQAEVSGYTPNEWTIKNNATYSEFLNPDGTFKQEKSNVDLQALIDQAKANGNTKLANELAVVRTKKILSNYDAYGRYMNEGDVAFMENQQTETGRQFDTTADLTSKEIETTERMNNYNTDASERMNAHNTDASERMNTYNTDATERMNTANNQNTLDQYDKAAQNGLTVNGSGTVKTSGSTLTGSQAKQAIMSGEVNEGTVAAYNKAYYTNYTVENPPKFDEDGNVVKELSEDEKQEETMEKLQELYDDSDKVFHRSVRRFLEEKLKPFITDKDNPYSETSLREFLIEYSDDYDLEVDDVRAIVEACGYDSEWVDNYKNSGLFGWGSGIKEKK